MGGGFFSALEKIVGAVLIAWGGVYSIIIGIALQIDSSQRDSRLRARQARDAFNASLIDRTIVIRSTSAPLQVAYGRLMVGGVLVFAQSTGTFKEVLHLVIALHPGHEIDGIEEIYFGPDPLGTLDGNGWTTGGKFVSLIPAGETFTVSASGSTNQLINVATLLASNPNYMAPNLWHISAVNGATYSIGSGSGQVSGNSVPIVGFTNTTVTIDTSGPQVAGLQIFVTVTIALTKPLIQARKYLGTTTQFADAILVAETGGKWTTAHRGLGRSYVALKMIYDENVFAGVDISMFQALIRAKKCFDPRTSLIAWTQCVPLHVRDYMIDPLGFRAAATEINDTKIIAAANTSDEDVPITDQARAANAVASIFDTVGDAKGWAGTNATVNPYGGFLRLTATTSNPQFAKVSGVSFAGTTYRTVRAKIVRIAGAAWTGRCYYSTAGHGMSTSFFKFIAEPTYDGNGVGFVEWDMSALTAGGSDWTSSVITGIRLDLGASTSDVFDIAWAFAGSENTQKRYQGNGMVSTESDRLGNLSVLLSPMGGFWSFSQGQFHIYAAAYRTPTVTLDETTITDKEPIAVNDTIVIRDLFNSVKGQFIDPNQLWQPVDYPGVTNAVYKANDAGEDLPIDVSQPMVTDSVQAQRLAKIILERARQATSFHASFNLKAYTTVPGDVVMLNLARYGFVSKPMLCTGRRFSLEKLCILDFNEEASTSYDWNMGQATLRDSAPNTALPAPGFVPVFGTITITQTFTTTPNKGQMPRFLVSWPATTEITVLNGGSIEMDLFSPLDAAWVRQPTLAGDVTSTVIDALIPNMIYQIRARYVKASGLRGQWTLSALAVATGFVAGVPPTFQPFDGLCPDPYFDDTTWWTEASYVPAPPAAGFYFEDADQPGNNVPFQMGVRRSVSISSSVAGHIYTGTGLSEIISQALPYSSAGQKVRFRARCYQGCNRQFNVGARFSDLHGTQISTANLVFSPSDGIVTKSVIATVPVGTALLTFYISGNGAGSAFSGNFGISEVKMDPASDTPDIPPGAITQTTEHPIADGTPGGGSYATFIDESTLWGSPIDTINVTPDADCIASVTYDCTCTGTNNTGAARDMGGGAGCMITLSTESFGTPINPSFYTGTKVPNVGINQTEYTTLTFTREFSLLAGVSYTFQLRLRRWNTPGENATHIVMNGGRFRSILRKR